MSKSFKQGGAEAFERAQTERRNVNAPIAQSIGGDAAQIRAAMDREKHGKARAPKLTFSEPPKRPPEIPEDAVRWRLDAHLERMKFNPFAGEFSAMPSELARIQVEWDRLNGLLEENSHNAITARVKTARVTAGGDGAESLDDVEVRHAALVEGKERKRAVRLALAKLIEEEAYPIYAKIVPAVHGWFAQFVGGIAADERKQADFLGIRYDESHVLKVLRARLFILSRSLPQGGAEGKPTFEGVSRCNSPRVFLAGTLPESYWLFAASKKAK